jgi:hypothetical protein
MTRPNVIYTCRLYFLHAECDFNTHKIGFYTQSKISKRRMWFYTQVVLSTYTRVSFKRMRVNMTLTSLIMTRLRVFLYAEYNFYTQSVISTHTRLVSTRRVRFSHAECDFTCRVILHAHDSKYACEYDTHKYDNDTLECDSYTQSVISTRRVWFQHSQDWFLHAE